MPSDDEFSDSDDEIFDYRQFSYGNGDAEVAPPVQDDIDTDIEDLTNALSRLTVSSLSSSSSSSLSSSSMDSDIPLDSLLDQLATVARQAADVLTSQFNVPIPGNLIDRILDLHPRNPIPRGPRPDQASTSQQPPEPWIGETPDADQPIIVWINAMPQGQGSQRICPVVAFFIIILMVLSHSEFPFPQ